ncbi:MAG: hypothetical protein A3J28_11780 [Acidobacteria bacterium RIFCSPLOWO2_12_FULL_60_22]|nr:MAG: hypothetical protein A3J28_11780 [Acidobacteria bacterium RIFCSPLOWO2_12_FULL_60_22]
MATAGFEDLWKGGSEPITLSEKDLCSVGRKWVYTFYHRKGERLIPGNFIFEGETHGFETT